MDSPADAEAYGGSGGGDRGFVGLAFVGEIRSDGGSGGEASRCSDGGSDDSAGVGTVLFSTYGGDFRARDGYLALFRLDRDGIGRGGCELAMEFAPGFAGDFDGFTFLQGGEVVSRGQVLCLRGQDESDDECRDEGELPHR